MPALLTPNEILSLSSQAAARLLEAGDGDCALLYLALLQGGGDGERARRALRWDEQRLSEAARRLAALELMRPEQAPKPAALEQRAADQPPEYTRADLAAALDREAEFKSLYLSIEDCLGRPLSDTDLRSLYTMYDFLALPAEVILLLAHYCVLETERRYGPGRRPRMSGVKKEAFHWKRQGLDTAERAEAYLRKQEALSGRERDLLLLVGIHGRAATDREREYLSAWSDMGFADDAIRLAYERTLFQKQNMSWPYMNSILKRWHQAGLHTAAQVEAGDRPAPRPSSQPAGATVIKPKENYQPTAERIQQNADWLDKFLEGQALDAPGRKEGAAHGL